MEEDQLSPSHGEIDKNDDFYALAGYLGLHSFVSHFGSYDLYDTA